MTALLPQDSQKEADKLWFDKNESCFPHIHPHTHMCTNTLYHSSMYPRMHIHTAHSHIRMYAQTCMHIHTYIHITHTHSHTHIHILIIVSLGVRTEAKLFPHPAQINSSGRLTVECGGGQRVCALPKFIQLRLWEAKELYYNLKSPFPPSALPQLVQEAT